MDKREEQIVQVKVDIGECLKFWITGAIVFVGLMVIAGRILTAALLGI